MPVIEGRWRSASRDAGEKEMILAPWTFISNTTAPIEGAMETTVSVFLSANRTTSPSFTAEYCASAGWADKRRHVTTGINNATNAFNIDQTLGVVEHNTHSQFSWRL